MVVKLESVAPLYADAYPNCQQSLSSGNQKRILMDNFVMDCPRRRKLSAALPALTEDDDEPMTEVVEPRQPRMSTYTLAEARRRHSPSPPRKDRLLPTRILPSLSEDEEP
ncbi:hypothetical protein EVAR_53307_1 [Eumeta japonica]|uniref:Uncharacterized protein n=1 Tax=Eumeta variegata TaxID=151549 RepID=A0A4C1X9X2_EUMVA|nr:hypothetical protein EVAR_53307_1 [Eumeta japonica]